MKTTSDNRWSEYQDTLDPTFYAYLPYESAAEQILSHCPRVIHGLLQTEAYAAALTQETAPPDRPAETIARQVRARMARQDILDRATAHFVLDEAALWRERGRNFTEELLDEQLVRLHELARRGVIIEYIPWHQPMTTAMAMGSFNLLDRQDSDRRLVYLERAEGGVMLDDIEQVDRYAEAFLELSHLAVDILDFTYR